MVHGGGYSCRGLDVTRGERGGAWEKVGDFGEVEDGRVSFYGHSGDVVGTGGHFGRGESAEPDPGLLLRFSDLGYPFTPCAHSDTPVERVLAAGGGGWFSLTFGVGVG